MSNHRTQLRKRMKNTFPLYTSKYFISPHIEDDEDDEDDDYGHFCEESGDDYQTTSVIWKQYNEHTHLRSLTQNRYDPSDTSDSEYAYEKCNDSSDSKQPLHESIGTIYKSMLTLVYHMFTYITLVIYKMKP